MWGPFETNSKKFDSLLTTCEAANNERHHDITAILQSDNLMQCADSTFYLQQFFVAETLSNKCFASSFTIYRVKQIGFYVVVTVFSFIGFVKSNKMVEGRIIVIFCKRTHETKLNLQRFQTSIKSKYSSCFFSLRTEMWVFYHSETSHLRPNWKV